MKSTQSINRSQTKTLLRISSLSAVWKTSLVCDLRELYRYLIDDFLIEYCRKISSKDYIVKTENLNRKKKGKREYLKNHLTRDLMTALDIYFETEVEIPRIRIGKRQTIETLVNEETLLLANFLSARGELLKIFNKLTAKRHKFRSGQCPQCQFQKWTSKK